MTQNKTTSRPAHALCQRSYLASAPFQNTEGAAKHGGALIDDEPHDEYRIEVLELTAGVWSSRATRPGPTNAGDGRGWRS